MKRQYHDDVSIYAKNKPDYDNNDVLHNHIITKLGVQIHNYLALHFKANKSSYLFYLRCFVKLNVYNLLMHRI